MFVRYFAIESEEVKIVQGIRVSCLRVLFAQGFRRLGLGSEGFGLLAFRAQALPGPCDSSVDVLSMCFCNL